MSVHELLEKKPSEWRVIHPQQLSHSLGCSTGLNPDPCPSLKHYYALSLIQARFILLIKHTSTTISLNRKTTALRQWRDKITQRKRLLDNEEVKPLRSVTKFQQQSPLHRYHISSQQQQ